MKRYDVCPMSGAGVAGRRKLVLVLQHEHLADIATVIVAPLYLPSELPMIAHLRVQARIGRTTYVVAIDRLASVPKKQLGRTTANFEKHTFAFTNALDQIFSGF